MTNGDPLGDRVDPGDPIRASEFWQSAARQRPARAAVLVGIAGLVAALICTRAALAAPNLWMPIGPEGGDVRTVAVAQTNASTLYAGTLGAGVFRSTDGGARWVAAGLHGTGIEEIVVDPSNPAVVYARGERSPEGIGLFKSMDSGRTWKILTIAGGVRGQTTALVIDPLTPTTLYAGLCSTGVYRSTDGGDTWTNVMDGLTELCVTALAIDPSDPTTLYAGTFRGVFKTTNGAVEWRAASTGLADDRHVTALAVDPSTPTTLYVGTHGGFFRSTDGGEKWTSSDAELPRPSIITALAFDAAAPAALYAIGPADCAGYFCWGTVFKSVDKGAHWTALDIGHASDLAQSIASGPDGAVYAGMTFGGIFRSTDAGASWSPRNAGLTTTSVGSLATGGAPGPTVYAGAFGGLFRSIDGGAWSRTDEGLANPDIGSLVVAVSDPTTLYVVAGTVYVIPGAGIFRSTDAGVSFAATAPLPRADVVAVDPTSATTVWAGTDGGVFRSTDGGEHWNRASGGLPVPADDCPCGPTSVRALVIDPTAPATIYAGVYFVAAGMGRPSYSEVFKTTDAGATWVKVSLDIDWVYAIAVDPAAPDTIMLVGNRVLLSTDSGATWNAVGGLPNTTLAVVIDPAEPTTLYAGTYFGVSKSTDRGATWRELNTGLTMWAGPNPYVTAIAIDPENRSILYAGTYFSGVFVLQQSPFCGGDCSGDGRVTIDELTAGITMALGSHPVSRCPQCDADANGTVEIPELILAVDHALSGCPS